MGFQLRTGFFSQLSFGSRIRRSLIFLKELPYPPVILF
jgi:hypothetical protein